MLFQARGGTAPLRLDFLLLEEFTLLGLAAAMEPLRAANRAAGQALYRWRVLSADGRPVASSSGMQMIVEGEFNAEAERDAVICVASFGVARQAAALARRLRTLARRGVTLGGIDSGAWVLAAAGLLDGYRATTHWEDLASFAASHPEVEVVPDRYVVDRGRITTGGATPALEMALDLIAANHGLNLSLMVANAFIYDHRMRAGEPQPLVPVGRLALDAPEVAEAIRIMERTLAAPIGVEAIARRVGVARRTLEVAFRRALATSINAYYLDLRLGHARRLLQHSRLSVTEIADRSGFSSSAAFARAFRRQFGETPGAARRTVSGAADRPGEAIAGRRLRD